MAEAKVLHRGIRRLAGWAVWSFFSEIQVIGGDNVPEDGPLIVCVNILLHLVPSRAYNLSICSAATHHNMMLDPAVLCACHSYITHVMMHSHLCSYSVSAQTYLKLLDQGLPVCQQICGMGASELRKHSRRPQEQGQPGSISRHIRGTV